MDIPNILSFDPPLPCRCFEPDIDKPNFGHYSKPATVGALTPVGLGFQIMPVCRDCAAKMAALYAESENARA